MVLSAVVFVACHGGSADHFATFTEELSKKSIYVEAHAAEPVLPTFIKRKIDAQGFALENTEAKANEIAQKILTVKESHPNLVVITDVGHSFAVKLHQALAERNIVHWAYYDNPEDWVPGGYSTTAAEVMLAAQGVLFANATLALAEIFAEQGQAINFENRKKAGLGYYPTQKADEIEKRRATEQTALRQELLPLEDLTNKKVAVYFGGNNIEYFDKAFPAFLRLLSELVVDTDLSHLVIVIQQHPAAKKKQIENTLVNEWKGQCGQNPHAPTLHMSDFGSDDAQVIADGAIYHQTSMNLQFALAGINPTFQVAHETYNDSLVKMGFPSVTTAEQLKTIIRDWNELHAQGLKKQMVLDKLETNPHWIDTLVGVISKPLL